MRMLVFFMLLLTGCATPGQRYLTEASDKEVFDACAQGCVIVPMADWIKIQQMLRAMGYRGT